MSDSAQAEGFDSGPFKKTRMIGGRLSASPQQEKIYAYTCQN